MLRFTRVVGSVRVNSCRVELVIRYEYDCVVDLHDYLLKEVMSMTYSVLSSFHHSILFLSLKAETISHNSKSCFAVTARQNIL